MNRFPRLFLAALLSLFAVSLALVGDVSAWAVQAVAHGQGVLWRVDHTSWLGNYELDDGNHGYCIDVARPAPHAADFDYVDGAAAGWFSANDSARLAFISRNWGAPGDPLTAAAAQLAVWSITGLAGHDQAYFAQRANDDADAVLAAANHMLGLADGAAGASRGATATVTLDLDGANGTVVSQLSVDYLAGAKTLPPASFRGRMTLRGATFDDGSSVAAVGNGVVTRIHPEQSGATEEVSVTVEYVDLPFGPGFRLGRNTGDSQNLLVTNPYPTTARATDARTAPTGLPFRPRVQTVSSAPVAEPGASVTDFLELGVDADSETDGEWGVYAKPDGSLAPIPVVIESVLLGPYPKRPEETEVVPADAPMVCTVETLVETGPGTVESPPCDLPAAGFYVWVDSIDPARTPPEQGGDRLRGWASRFGVAQETTVVPATPTIATVASMSSVTGQECVHDRLTISGLPAGADPITVTSTLLGPLATRPEPGTTPDGWADFPVAGTVTTVIASDGEHASPCINVSAPGFYYFVFTSPGSAPTPPASVASPDSWATPPTSATSRGSASTPPASAPTPDSGVTPPTSAASAPTPPDSATSPGSAPAALTSATSADSESISPNSATAPGSASTRLSVPGSPRTGATALTSAATATASPASDANETRGIPSTAAARTANREDLAALVPPFADHSVHESESVAVVAPPGAPTPPPAQPPAPAAPPAPDHLAQTGAAALPTAMSTSLAVLAIIAGLAAVGVATRRWR